jgi:hypothetical protein
MPNLVIVGFAAARFRFCRDQSEQSCAARNRTRIFFIHALPISASSHLPPGHFYRIDRKSLRKTTRIIAIRNRTTHIAMKTKQNPAERRHGRRESAGGVNLIAATCQKGNPREIAAFESLTCPAGYSPIRAFSLRIVLARRPVPIVAVLANDSQ